MRNPGYGGVRVRYGLLHRKIRKTGVPRLAPVGQPCDGSIPFWARRPRAGLLRPDLRNSAKGYASLERRYAGRAPIGLEYRSLTDERPLAGPEISATGLQFGDWGSFGADGACLFQPDKRNLAPVPTSLREAIAINLVRERGHDRFRSFTADDLENLRKTMDDIRIFCAYGMEAMIDMQVRNASAVGVAA